MAYGSRSARSRNSAGAAGVGSPGAGSAVFRAASSSVPLDAGVATLRMRDVLDGSRRGLDSLAMAIDSPRLRSGYRRRGGPSSHDLARGGGRPRDATPGGGAPGRIGRAASVSGGI
ncbi:MAG: hypothetical protein WKF75_09720 [Singulisphaera sp.]